MGRGPEQDYCNTNGIKFENRVPPDLHKNNVLI